LEPGTDAGPPQAEEPAEPRQSTPFLVLRFFIFPMAIVAVCVAVFVIFGLIAGESHGAREYLAEVRSGGANRRWQAAFELSKVLQAGKDPALKDPKFAVELTQLFAESGNDDPRVRRYLALAMGRLGDRRAVLPLREALADQGSAGAVPDADTQIYAIWALGAIGDPTSLPDLERLAASPDAGLRKAAVHALGVFPGETARQALITALTDATEDVRWNAAIALARRGDAAATPVLLTLLDRGHLDKVEGLRPDQRDEALLQAVAVARALPDPAVQEALGRLQASDPSLKVREAARKSLEGREPPR
jgi:HEAT repeat protein